MSTHNFLSYFQQLLTMIDPENRYSIALARAALNTTIDLARLSDETDSKTLRVMIKTLAQFEYFVQHRAEFMRVPDDHEENSKRRRKITKKFQHGE